MCHISVVQRSKGNVFSQETVFYIQHAGNDTCCNIFFKRSKGCLVTDVHRGEILGQKVLAVHACNQPRSGKRCTGLRHISASFASQGALRHVRTYNPSGYLTSATCIAALSSNNRDKCPAKYLAPCFLASQQSLGKLSNFLNLKRSENSKHFWQYLSGFAVQPKEPRTMYPPQEYQSGYRYNTQNLTLPFKFWRKFTLLRFVRNNW